MMAVNAPRCLIVPGEEGRVFSFVRRFEQCEDRSASAWQHIAEHGVSRQGEAETP